MTKTQKVRTNCTFHFRDWTIRKGRVGVVLKVGKHEATVEFKACVIPVPRAWLVYAPPH